MRCLVLNMDYTFLGICSPESAISAWYSGKASIEESYETVWHSSSMEVRVPAVIRLKKFIHIVYERIAYVSYTKRNVHLRDNFTCQYCGVKMPQKDLTVDHVIPEARGGPTNWENCVSACCDCNYKKDDKTPGEAGMILIRPARKPHGFKEIVRIKIGEISDLWAKYLY
jgi:5-methylcytosine-specific restriction endonuclease McrA